MKTISTRKKYRFLEEGEDVEAEDLFNREAGDWRASFYVGKKITKEDVGYYIREVK